MLLLDLPHWAGLAFDDVVADCAEVARAEEVKKYAARMKKDGMGIDLIANVLAMIARRR